MEPNTEGNLLEIIDLARTLRQEQLFIQQEQTAFTNLTEALTVNSKSINKLAYICAEQRRNLHDLVVLRNSLSPKLCCQRLNQLDKVKFIDAIKVMDYEHVMAFEKLFNFLYGSPYVLAMSLATGDRLADITVQHMNSVIHTISSGLFGNAICTKDVEMILKLLRELLDIQIVSNEAPRRLLRVNSSAFARLYHHLIESMFSTKIFLTAALFEPIMDVLSSTVTILDVDPNKVMKSFSTKEKFRRFGAESSCEYQENIERFHTETIEKLYEISKKFIDNLSNNWSLFPSTLRWLIQTTCHQLRQSHNFTEAHIHEIITDMIFTHFICPAIVNPDNFGIVDAPISEQVRLNLIQIGQIIQTMSLAKYNDIDPKFKEIHAKFNTNVVTELMDLLLESPSGEDVVAILAQQSEFERRHLFTRCNELNSFVEFFRILLANNDYDIPLEDKERLQKILSLIPDALLSTYAVVDTSQNNSPIKEKSKQAIINLSKTTKSKLNKTVHLSAINDTTNNCNGFNGTSTNNNANPYQIDGYCNGPHNGFEIIATTSQSTPLQMSPSKLLGSQATSASDEKTVLMFNLYIVENKIQPLSEEEVLKMNSIGQDISSGELGASENYQMESTVDKSSVVNGFDGISDVLRTERNKTSRFSLSHDDASIGNSDNLEAVSEAPSNHSVTSSLELEENDQNDNLSDMVSANVSGRGTPNISGRDTPSSQVTDGGSLNNAIPTPQMQKLISKARSDIEDKFCKFEIKKFEVDENVSIISDTWSTDVLASDSEVVDAVGERDQERNFSTPLIPASVVLPGDSNFDALSTARGLRGSGNYWDSTDQRSESNWSTDVLASDSEKQNEIDTDDNASITARSDTTDTGSRFVHERDQLAAAISAVGNRQRCSNSSRSASSRSNRGSRAANNYTNNNHKHSVGCVRHPEDEPGSGSSGGNVSDRSQEDSAFYDAINSYDDNTISPNNAAKNEEIISSLARSSMRTTNQTGGENTFQQNYKSTNRTDEEKDPFLNAKQITDENSIDTRISDNNSNISLDVNIREMKTLNGSSGKNADKGTEGTDLIDFSDFINEKDVVCTTIEPINPVDNVEHRRMSTQQRMVSFDGRRNGMMAMKGNGETMHLNPALRKHQSLNYENHEIMINATISKHISAAPDLLHSTNTVGPTAVNQNLTKDETKEEKKTIEPATTLCAKLVELQLEDNCTEDHTAINQEQLAKFTSGSTSSMMASMTSIMTTPTSANQKANRSTGAIPKSISFDASADKSPNVSNGMANRSRSFRFQDANLVPTANNTANSLSGLTNNSGIFNKLKQGIFKHRRNNKSHRQNNANGINEDVVQTYRNVSFSTPPTHSADISLEILSSNSISHSMAERSLPYYDINEDILAKYRRKVSSSSETTNSSNSNGLISGAGACGSVITNDLDHNKLNKTMDDFCSNGPTDIIPDKTLAFAVIKKKIRTVLSKTNLHSGDFRHTTHTNAPALLTYLQIQLAQAVNLQNFQQISYVSEAIRCISTLESVQYTQLLDELQSDIQKRQSYLQYLMRYRQNLLLIMENVEQYDWRLRSENSSCNRYLMAVCMRLFIDTRLEKIDAFQEDFARLTVSDDKIDLIEEFLNGLMEDLLSSGGILYGMPPWQIEEARNALERILLQCMYHQVMFPNEDADLSRDGVLSEHISKLQDVITPQHPALCIPQEYLDEAPWLFAQQQLRYISAYKTPREKLQCVIKCISSIMSLLQMSSGRTPAADDILPVLIYVVIMVNPPYLLSTVEYITCFIGDKLVGEDQFHWTLFGSVVNFIKTMD